MWRHLGRGESLGLGKLDRADLVGHNKQTAVVSVSDGVGKVDGQMIFGRAPLT